MSRLNLPIADAVGARGNHQDKISMEYVPAVESSCNNSTDLFGWARLGERYPEIPGAKAPGPRSQEVARAICGHAGRLRKAAILELASAGPKGLSADQIADRLGESVLSVRPRISELRASGEVVPTGRRVVNDSGMSASVWKLSATVGGQS
jgi:hypothetical protein